MRIEGRWLAGTDGGVLIPLSLLIDTGADLTVLSHSVAAQPDGVVQPVRTEFLAPGSLELSVIGRNLLDQFTLIYSRPQGTLLLLTPPDTFALSP